MASNKPGYPAPTRQDRFLAGISEPVGGPLGKYAAPGLVRSGLFTVDRVLVLMVALSAVIALAFQQHCRTVGWNTPDQYSTMCFSTIPNSLQQAAHPGSGAFSPLLKLLGAVTVSYSTAVSGSLAGQKLAMFDANALLIVVAWMLAALVTGWALRRQPWNAAVVAASPLLLLTAFSSWSVWAMLLAALVCWLFSRSRFLASGAVMGIGVAVHPALLVLAMAAIALVMAHRRFRLAAGIAGMVAGAWLLMNLPELIWEPGAWVGYIGSYFSKDPSVGSIYYAVNAVTSQAGFTALSPLDAAVTSLALLLAGVVLILIFTLRAQRLPSYPVLAFLLLGWVLLINSQAGPGQYLILLPVIALCRPGWLANVIWQVLVLAFYCAYMLQLAVIRGDGNTQHGIDAPYYVLALAFAVLGTVGLAGVILNRYYFPARGLRY